MNLIPGTVISGFSGAGKTTLLRRIAGAREGQKVAVLTSAMDGGDRARQPSRAVTISWDARHAPLVGAFKFAPSCPASTSTATQGR